MPMMRVVAADDSAILRNVFRSVLRPPEFDLVGIAENGLQAVDLCRKHKPDIAILDVSMPVLGGDFAAETIHAEKIASHILLVTSLKLERVLDVAKRTGAGLLIKQYRPEQLVKAIKECVGDGA